MIGMLPNLAIYIALAATAIILHELAHGFAALALVALAGPAMNVTLAFLAAHLLLLPHLPRWGEDVTIKFMTFNLVLGIFNLLPLPPLDGGRIMVGILPRRAAIAWAGLERYGILIVMVLVAAPALLRQSGVAFDPLGQTLIPAVGWVFDRILWLAGVNDAV